jgi:16S rRNA (guanine966-N2)-methyltransferase
LRVIAGEARSVPLVAPKGDATRPTSDLLKGAIFSALGERAGQGRVLDLFAGSGGLGIEALSRGADWCDFVDSSRAACQAIQANLAKTRVAGRARVHCLPVQRWLGQAARTAAYQERGTRNEQPRYDLILVDPPYTLEGQDDLLRALAGSAVVDEQTVLVLEHSSRRAPLPALGPLQAVKTRTHGDSAFTVYVAP